FTVTHSGNVGIGSPNPAAKLDIASFSGDLVHLIGFEPFITFYDSNSGYSRGAIQGVRGGLNLFTDSYLSAVNPSACVTLLTSGTPGHAMRVSDHPRAQGAIIGKAMGSLGNGRGLVLVLVSLQ